MSNLVPNKLALIKKQKQLQELALSFIPKNVQKRDEMAKALIDTFVDLTPPLVDGGVFEMRMLTLKSEGISGGQSTKPGNIYLNFEKLLRLIPDIVLTIFGVTGPEWVLFFVALHIWSALWHESTIDIDQNHAMVMYAMWNKKDSRNRISEDDAFDATNSHLSKYGIQPLAKKQFTAIIDNLCKMECVELSEGIIWLREWVKTTY